MARVDAAVTSGRAAEKFDQMVAALGGPDNFADTYKKHLPVAAIVRPVFSEETGVLSRVDAHAVGNAIIVLGGGRRMLGEKLDLAVGFTDIAHIGDTIDFVTPLATIHAATEEQAEEAAMLLRAACEISEADTSARPVIYDILTGD